MLLAFFPRPTVVDCANCLEALRNVSQRYTKANDPSSQFDTLYATLLLIDCDQLVPVPCDSRGGELLASISFVKECEQICKKRLRREMSFNEANFNGRVVGNLQVSKHIKSNVAQAREDRIFCRYPVFSIDTLENRILKAALKKAQSVFRENNIQIVDIGRMYSYCENALKEVRTVPITKSDFNRVNLTGFNSYYKNVIELAKTVLLKNGINALSDSTGETIKYVIPYSINMETLFEFYVRASLKESIKALPETGIVLDEYRAPKKNPLTTLKNSDSKAYLMQHYVPDIALIDTSGEEAKYVAVFDVKYQSSLTGVYANTRRHNSHQLIFYTLLLNVDKCGFIFPNKENDQNTENWAIYELNIHVGSAMDQSDRFYSQWTMESANAGTPEFATQLLRYVQGLM